MAVVESGECMSYKILEKIAIADIAFEITGQTPAQLFEEAALAVTGVMVDIRQVKAKRTHTISLKAGALDTLLYDFLSELVYLKDAEKLVVRECTVSIAQKGKAYALEAALKGDTLGPAGPQRKTDVKAITMHLLEVKKTGKGWRAVVVVDI